MSDLLDMALLQEFGDEPEQEKKPVTPEAEETSSPYDGMMADLSSVFSFADKQLLRELEVEIFERVMQKETEEIEASK